MRKNADRIRTKDDGIRVIEHGKGPGRGGPWAIAALAAVILATASWQMWDANPAGPAPEELAARPGIGLQAGSSRDPQQERSRRHGSVRAARHVAPGAPAADAVPMLDAKTMQQLVEGTAETAPERSAEEIRENEKTAREMIAAAVAAGATTGIAAFPPPGTDPIKVGLVVPKNYELPEGFIRHHQITDDGRRLEPILMFSPDYEFVDAAGNPVAVPEDGIVPAEMAPPGLPLRVLAVPKDPYGPSIGLH